MLMCILCFALQKILRRKRKLSSSHFLAVCLPVLLILHIRLRTHTTHTHNTHTTHTRTHINFWDYVIFYIFTNVILFSFSLNFTRCEKWMTSKNIRKNMIKENHLFLFLISSRIHLPRATLSTMKCKPVARGSSGLSLSPGETINLIF